MKTDLFWYVVDECLLSLSAEFSSLLLQCSEPVEHGVLATGLQGYHTSVASDLKLMLAQVLYVIGQGGRGYLNFAREGEGERERERERACQR